MKAFIILYLYCLLLLAMDIIKYKFENKKSLKDKYFKNIILHLSGEMYLFNSTRPESTK